MDPKVKFVISVEPWDGEQDHIVGIRPYGNPENEVLPLGPISDEKSIQWAVRWLQSAMPRLQEIILEAEKGQEP